MTWKGERIMDEHDQNDDLKAFLIILRQALLMIVRWIEHKYQLGAEKPERRIR